MATLTAPVVAQLDPVVIEDMRGWLSDCSWRDLGPEDVARLSVEQVVAGVRRHYVGGVEQFVVDSGRVGDDGGLA